VRLTCSQHGIFTEVVDPVLLDTAIAAHLAAYSHDPPEPDIVVVMESETPTVYPREGGDVPEKRLSDRVGELLTPPE
jgi:hypothetical protein